MLHKRLLGPSYDSHCVVVYVPRRGGFHERTFMHEDGFIWSVNGFKRTVTGSNGFIWSVNGFKRTVAASHLLRFGSEWFQKDSGWFQKDSDSSKLLLSGH